MTMESRVKRGGITCYYFHASISEMVNRFGDQVREYIQNRDEVSLFTMEGKDSWFGGPKGGFDYDSFPYPMSKLVEDIHAEVRRAVAEPEPGQEDYEDMIAELDEILEGPGCCITSIDDLDSSLLDNLYGWADWWDVRFDSGLIKSYDEE